MAAECQAVVIALSDCGSCTSCSTHDLVDLDRRGLPGVSVLTEEFRDAVRAAVRGDRLRRRLALRAASDAEPDDGGVASVCR